MLRSRKLKLGAAKPFPPLQDWCEPSILEDWKPHEPIMEGGCIAARGEEPSIVSDDGDEVVEVFYSS